MSYLAVIWRSEMSDKATIQKLRKFFLFLKSIKWELYVTVQIASNYKTHGTWVKKKIPKVYDLNTYLWLDFENLVDILFLFILYNFEVERTFFGQSNKKRTNHPIGLKIFLRSNRTFKNWYKTWEWEEMVFTCLKTSILSKQLKQRLV